MTPSPDLPPSIDPDDSSGRRRENDVRPASARPSSSAGSRPAVRRPSAPAGRSTGSRGRDPRSAAPSRQSAVPSGASGAQQGAAPPRRSLRSGSPQRAAQPPDHRSGGGSRARRGSSAVPLGGRSASAPEPTRALPGRGASPDARGRAAFPVGTSAPRPDGPAHPPTQPDTPERPHRRRPLRWLAALLVLLLVLTVGRAAWLWYEVDSKLQRVDALTGAKDTPGETWLIVGSDSRADGGVPQDGTEGSRADSIMVLHKATNGQASLISLPRDTYVEIPGYDDDKINAAYSYGQAPLLMQTAEKLTGLTMDHYVEVGMGGVTRMVDAVGGIRVCLDYDVDDADSSLVWDTSKGTCQTVDGDKALAYSRMRKSDPTGDIGRAQRQRAVVSAVVSKALSPTTLINPFRQGRLVDSGTRALTVDEDASTLDLAQMALAFRSASNDGLTGAPPIESLDYEPGGIGAAVLLQDTTAPDFFSKVRAGQLTAKDFDQP